MKYIKAAIVITLGICAYIFISGESYYPPIDEQKLNSTMNEAFNTADTIDRTLYGDVSSFTATVADIKTDIIQIKEDQTLYNRIFSKEHYYEKEKIEELEAQYAELDEVKTEVLSTYFEDETNFNEVLQKKIEDEDIHVKESKNKYEIGITGHVAMNSIGNQNFYHIITQNGNRYYWEEPPFESSTTSFDYYRFKGEQEYTLRIK